MIGALWFLAQVAGCGVVWIGIFVPRLMWMNAPWWWLVMIALNADSTARHAAAGRWWIAALFALAAFASVGYALFAFAGHQKAAHRTERWEWSP
jgi:hypothetical protein